MVSAVSTLQVAPTSPSSRRAWIEILTPTLPQSTPKASPSSRRAWIEIPHFGQRMHLCRVALLAEGVDRNSLTRRAARRLRLVALLAEGVDRNNYAYDDKHAYGFVALLAEGVDRNRATAHLAPSACGSPSSRRAWIEIPPRTARKARPRRRPPRGGRG